MAKFRQVHTTFWQDPRVLEEMTPEDKYFYLYLLTNPNTTQIGVYQITKKQMAFDLGYSQESINSLLERFINSHKIVKYNEKTREIAILNWGKYNLNKSGKPVIDCVKKELREIKDQTLLNEIAAHIENQDIYREFSRYVDESYNDTLTTSGQEEEKEKEKEKEEEKEKPSPLQITNLRQRYSENQLKIIDEYLDMIRHTRKSAKIADSVILKLYKSWDKYPPICVEYGLRIHTENPAYHSKMENYTLDIIRNTTEEADAHKLKGGGSTGTNKQNDAYANLF